MFYLIKRLTKEYYLPKSDKTKAVLSQASVSLNEAADVFQINPALLQKDSLFAVCD